MILPKPAKPLLCSCLLLGLWLFGLAGCTQIKALKLPWISKSAPKEIPQTQDETEALIKRLEQKRLSIKSIAVKGGAHVVTPEDNLFGDHMIIAQAPGQLRAEVFGPFGQPALVVVCNGVFLTIMDYQNNRAFKGAASKENMSKFLGLELSPPEIYATLIGSPSLQDAANPQSVTRENGSILLKAQPPDKPGWMYLQLEPKTELVQRVWYSSDEEKQTWQKADMRVIYRQFSNENYPIRVPLQLEFEDKSGRELELQHNEVRINPELPEDIFNLEIPEGIKIIPLN